MYKYDELDRYANYGPVRSTSANGPRPKFDPLFPINNGPTLRPSRSDRLLEDKKE